MPRDAGVAVWAPLASRVEVVLGDHRVRLHASPGGWWRADVAIVPGTDYAFVLDDGFVYDGRPSRFRGRRHGRPPHGLPGHRFLAYLQNHDQVGNRAKGERTSHLVGTGRLAIGAAVVLTAPFVPMLFQGEEWGASTPFPYFVEHEDQELARAVRDGRQHEFAAFGWKPEEVPDPLDARTFDRSRLAWSERTAVPHASLLDWYRALIRYRRATPSLLDGRLDRVSVRYDGRARWLAIQRGEVVTACTIGDEAADVPLPSAAPATLRLASDPGVRLGPAAVRMPPETAAIVELERSWRVS